jgi:hypothetical protein
VPANGDGFVKIGGFEESLEPDPQPPAEGGLVFRAPELTGGHCINGRPAVRDGLIEIGDIADPVIPVSER